MAVDTALLVALAHKVKAALDAGKDKIREYRDLGLTPDKDRVAAAVRKTYEGWDPHVSGIAVLNEEIRQNLAVAIAGIALNLFDSALTTGGGD